MRQVSSVRHAPLIRRSSILNLCVLLGFSASYLALMVAQETDKPTPMRLSSASSITIALPVQSKVSKRAELIPAPVQPQSASAAELTEAGPVETQAPLVMASNATPVLKEASQSLASLPHWAFDPNPALPVEPSEKLQENTQALKPEQDSSAPSKAALANKAPAKVKSEESKQTPNVSPRQMANASPKPKAVSEPKEAASRSIFEKWFSRDPEDNVQALAYAQPNDSEILSNPVLRRDNISPSQDRFTAIYDIEARTVYLPNGEALEAHSGLGNLVDDPRYVHVKNRGSTPPNLYRLTERESLFHGVRALRLTPIGGNNMYNRDGILAHSYMLGGNGQSNGCVSFRDYNKFLQAFLRGEINQIKVVARRS